MNAKNVVVDHPGQRQPIEHGVARLPHLLSEVVAESILTAVWNARRDVVGKPNAVRFQRSSAWV